MQSLPLPFTFLFFTALICTSAIILSTTEVAPSNGTDENLSETCNPLCNATCQVCQNKTCSILNNTCYIGRQCYNANESFKNDNLSCLQCQPDKNQTQWTFKPECSAGASCLNPLFLVQNTCPTKIIEAFYTNPDEAVINFYNFNECGRDRTKCQAGFFVAGNETRPLACCSGNFCPVGQVCMIPCRPGSYCPSPLHAVDGMCQTPVGCPQHQPTEFEQYGCGGSTFEGFCPAESYCTNSTVSMPCPNSTSYCPTGVVEPLPCLSHFECVDGRAHRGYLFRLVLGTVGIFLIIYIACAKVTEKLNLQKKLFAQKTSLNPSRTSAYFRKRTTTNSNRRQFELNIHLYQATLRDVTRFDPVRNEGFTGRISAGRITALMGGSGCGKSSLLDTIHGRRRLRSGSITFANHQPLSNILTDYIGYVPQADIMHNDLTVFETVFYSARTRRLGDPINVIKNDVCFVLNTLGLGNMYNSMTETLSGGQRKRVNVAIEVAACPKVLLLDEPTSGLDTASCDDLFDLLELIKFSEAGPVTIIMVIHQPSYELFQRIDDIFFLTPLCCLAYQGPRERALEHLKRTLFERNPEGCPPARHNDSDTCFIMLTKAQEHISNVKIDDEQLDQYLSTYSWKRRAWLPFYYVIARSTKQVYLRGVLAEAAYMVAYFLLGACIGYLFQNQQQDACEIKTLPTIYFLISLAYGILTCISSQRLFGVEIINKTYERESRTYFHPIQYWFAKSFVDFFRLTVYPLLFLSMLYIQLVPRASFSDYYGVLLLLSFVCSGIGQISSVVFNRTEYAYLGGTIIALLSCLLSGFSPRKEELGSLKFVVTFSFSRHVQHLLFRKETAMYVQKVANGPHLWSVSVEIFRKLYSFEDSEQPYLWLLAIGIVLRIIAFVILYIKSEYRSEHRFCFTHCVPILKSVLSCEPCRTNTLYHRELSVQL